MTKRTGMAILINFKHKLYLPIEAFQKCYCVYCINKGKFKYKIVPVHGMKACRENGGIAALIVNPGTTWR